jgi:hypothetical protein
MGAIHEANARIKTAAALFTAYTQRARWSLIAQGTVAPAPFAVTPQTQHAVRQVITRSLPRGHTLDRLEVYQPYWDPATRSWRQTVHAVSMEVGKSGRLQPWTGHVRADGSRRAILVRW